MYMSYCRFEGTRMELNRCMNEVQDHINESAEYEVSKNEIEQFKQMVYEFVGFLYDNAILDTYGEINEETLDEVCESMAKSFAENEEVDW